MAKGKESSGEKKPYYELIAETLIKQLEEGTAPWQKPWEPGTSMVPHNPVSGTKYRGGNALWLTMQGRSDPRWMTYKQAQSVNAQVKRGESGTLIQYFKFQDQVPKLDASGKPEIDSDGKKKMITVQLDKPKVFSAVVFNGEQIQGLPPIETEKKDPAWNRHERAEAILTNAGIPISHDQADNAFYLPGKDEIHLPGRDQFATADRYYATALHELGHATGHASRLNRDLSGRFGSESYAKEELRAEIGSLLIGDELEIGHDPGQHAAYVKSWVKVLKEDPKEILRAARDAEAIKDWVIARERESTLTGDNARPPQTQQEDQAVSLAETRKLMEIVANQNKGATLGDSASLALKALGLNETKQVIDVISTLNDLVKHPALAQQVKKAEAELALLKPQHQEQHQEPKATESAATDNKPQTEAFSETRKLMDIVANQNKGAALGESAAVALEGLARNQPDQANDVISNLSDLQKHPALAKQIEKAKAEQEAIRATQGADQGQRIDPISKLPLALAEKLSSRFANEEDRAKFLEKVQARLSDAPQPEIKIREAVATSKEPKAQAEDMER
ncbi:zincin-like metallopeptidase domain-containing protein [Escherichia coli]